MHNFLFSQIMGFHNPDIFFLTKVLKIRDAQKAHVGCIKPEIGQ